MGHERPKTTVHKFDLLYKQSKYPQLKWILTKHMAFYYMISIPLESKDLQNTR